MFQPLVTCVVTVYNLADCIQRCIDSLLAQDYKNLKILIIDDGSTDESLSVCQAMEREGRSIAVLTKNNGGQSSARNYAVSRIDSGYVVFIDGDDVVTPDFVSTLVGALPASPRDNAVCMVSVGLHQTGKPEQWLNGYSGSHASIVRSDSEQALRKLLTQKGINESPCGKLAPISLWSKVPFPEGRVYEDLAIMARLIDNADEVAMVDADLYGQVFREGSITRRKISTKQFENFESAIFDVVEYVTSRAGNFDTELFSFQVLMCVRLIRLSTDVVEPDSHVLSSRESARSFLIDEEKKIYSCSEISAGLKAKTVLALHAPWLYRFLYEMNEKKKRNV